MSEGSAKAGADGTRLLLAAYLLIAPLALWAAHVSLGLDALWRGAASRAPEAAAAGLLHLVSGALVMLLAGTLAGGAARPAPVLAGALFFLAHPLQLETLARAEALPIAFHGALALGALAAFAAWIRAPRRALYGLATAFAAGAALTGVSPLALPIALLAWAALSGDPGGALRKALPPAALALGIASVRAAFAASSPGAAAGPSELLWYGLALGPWRAASLDGDSTAFVAFGTLVGWALYNAADRRPGLLGLALLGAASAPAAARMAASGPHGLADGAYYLPIAAAALLLSWALGEARLAPPERRRSL